MKFAAIFVILSVFRKSETVSQGFKNSVIGRSFVDISMALASQNHLVSVVVDDEFDDLKFAVFSTTAGIPHTIT